MIRPRKRWLQALPKNSSIGNRRRARGVLDSVWNICAGRTKPTLSRFPPRSKTNQILRWSRSLPRGSGAGLSAALSSPRRTVSSVRSAQNQTSGPRRPGCSRSIPVRQQIVPRTHRPNARQEHKPHSVLESFRAGNSIHGWDRAGDRYRPRTPSSSAGRTSPGLGELSALVELVTNAKRLGEHAVCSFL
jgi:hypothetical protein